MTSEGSQLALDLYDLLRDLDPSRWRADVEASTREKLTRIQRRVAELVSKGDDGTGPLVAPIHHVRAVLREHRPAHDLTGADLRAAWMSFRQRMVPAYQSLAQVLHAHEIHVPALRPTNYNRTAFHVASALGVLVLAELVLPPFWTIVASGGFALGCWFLETGRRISKPMNDRLMRVRFFQLIIHPHEHYRVNSATWYASALILLALTSPLVASACGLAVLGSGDPVAALVGRRWGRLTLAYGRTLEGTVAFVVVATLAAFGVLLLWHPVAPWPLLLAIAAAAAVSGAVAELGSKFLDDNFTIPLVAAAGAALAAGLLGVL